MDTTNADAKAKALLDVYEGDYEQASRTLKRIWSAGVSAKRNRPLVAADAPVVASVRDLTKSYKLGRQHVDALKGVSLDIREGEFVALTGPSGSGKSTLLQLLGGLDKPSSGVVEIAGENIAKLSDRKLSTFRGETIGFVFQFFYLQPFLRLQTNLEVPGMFSRIPRAERATRAKKLADAVGLGDRVKHLPKELSGGQMQRAAVARALLNHPKLLLADEPTGNLDSKNGAAIVDLFDKARNELGTTVVIVTHDPIIAGRADREIVLKDGVIVS